MKLISYNSEGRTIKQSEDTMITGNAKEFWTSMRTSFITEMKSKSILTVFVYRRIIAYIDKRLERYG